MERRNFLTALGATAVAAQLPLRAGSSEGDAKRITLLHTNDTHSRIEPFPPNSGTNSGKGGIARRATLVKKLRKDLGAGVLLLDAGDVFQGTPYFNKYKGTLDYELMSLVGYDAGTLGNHDFDNGTQGLIDALPYAKFPFVSCNLDCSGAPELAKRVQPCLVREVGGLRVGITGAVVQFKGLVSPKNHEGVVWQDPVETLRPIVRRLREVEKVDLVVLLSHLGHDMQGKGHDDLNTARLVPGIDAIIGGHSHTFLEEPVRVKNELGETLIFQVGFGGINLGRMDFTVAKGGTKVSSAVALSVSSSLLV